MGKTFFSLQEYLNKTALVESVIYTMIETNETIWFNKKHSIWFKNRKLKQTSIPTVFCSKSIQFQPPTTTCETSQCSKFSPYSRKIDSRSSLAEGNSTVCRILYILDPILRTPGQLIIVVLISGLPLARLQSSTNCSVRPLCPRCLRFVKGDVLHVL